MFGRALVPGWRPFVNRVYNPELFIESNTDNSWNEYINNMSMQGTWCDALLRQAVADCQNVAIRFM